MISLNRKSMRKGIKQGTEKGIERVALNLLKNGEPAEKVAFYTGLSIEKIASLNKTIFDKN